VCLSVQFTASKNVVRGSYTQRLECIFGSFIMQGHMEFKAPFWWWGSSLMLGNRGFELELDRGPAADVHSLV
jgi:hypothetical protein